MDIQTSHFVQVNKTSSDSLQFSHGFVWVAGFNKVTVLDFFNFELIKASHALLKLSSSREKFSSSYVIGIKGESHLEPASGSSNLMHSWPNSSSSHLSVLVELNLRQIS
ncbi:hypothetical protein WICPIJ_005746 [Wickerhamomyces pijperi]|uniref:Uncharacterized protein n=1 Tax=Wickerhamomyces pijperi TaxID=599730 RepID=A0A9P8Q550_WICPI|nr:hypothetical protein WICPIJ_005746 [Wickerhamomyces pijperi]